MSREVKYPILITIAAIILGMWLCSIAEAGRTISGSEGFYNQSWPDTNEPGWSVAGWVKPDVNNVSQVWFTMCDGGSNNNYISIGNYNTGRLRMTILSPSEAFKDGAYFINAGEWNHFACAWKSDDTVYLWTNGLGGLVSGTLTGRPYQIDRLGIGFLYKETPSYTFEGSLADIVFWDANTLTDAVVRDLYTRRWSGEVWGTPLASWRLAEENENNTAVDSIGGVYTGSLSGTPDPIASPTGILYTAGDPTGSIFYVCDTNGSDTYDGTADSYEGGIVGPRKTIEEAYRWIQANETIQIRTGTYYNETVTMTNGPGGVTIMGYPGETAIMSGGIPVTGWTQCLSNDPNLTVDAVTNPNYASIYWAYIAPENIIDANHIELYEGDEWSPFAAYPQFPLPFNNTILYNPSNNGTATTIIDTVNLTGTANEYVGAHVIIWKDVSNITYWTDRKVISFDAGTDTATTDGIWYDTADDIIDTNKRYGLFNRPQWLDAERENYLFHTDHGSGYKIFYWPANAGAIETSMEVAYTPYAFTIPVTCGTGITIKDLTIKRYSLIAIDSWLTSGLTIENVKMYGIGRVSRPRQEAVVDRRGMFIRNCTSDLTITDCILRYAWDSGFTLESCQAFRVYDPNVTKTGGTCFQLKTSSGYGAIIGGYLYDTGAHGNGMSIYGTCSNTLIKDITLYDFVADGVTFNTASNIVLFNCLLDHFDNSTASLSYWAGTYTACSIYNSALVSGNWGLDTYDMDSDCKFRNCIFSAITNSGTDNAVYSNNAFLGTFQSGTNHLDLTAVDLSTVFTDITNNDYTLVSGSPLIGTGINVMSELTTAGIIAAYPDIDFTKDIAGVTRGDTWDIGPYEYESGAPPTTYVIFRSVP